MTSNSIIIELENDSQNTLVFDLDAQKESQKGFTKFAVGYQYLN